MDFLELAKKRCSIRKFTDEPIKQEDLDQILSAGRVAPTACNRQPQRIIVVRQQENIEKVQKAYRTFGSPCILIVCRDKRTELVRPSDGESKRSGDLDIGIISDHMVLEARELNIGSVIVGDFDAGSIREEFDLPEYIQPTTLLMLGYPAKGFLESDRHKTTRKPLEATVMYENYSENGSVN